MLTNFIQQLFRNFLFLRNVIVVLFSGQISLCVLTALSSPSVSNMRKKMSAQPTDPGSVAIASGYTTKTKPGPETW